MRPIDNSYLVPGTQLIAGEYPGSPSSNRPLDLEIKLTRFLDAGIDVFIDLTAPSDPLEPYEPTMRALADRKGIKIAYERLTIRDMDVCDKPHMSRVLDTIDGHLSAARKVYLHCWGGVGRTGTVVGCWLVRHGKTGKEALDEVARLFATMSEAKSRQHPEGSPQTGPQRRMVEGWSEGV